MNSFFFQNEDGTKVEYRVWNPFRSKLAAAIIGGVDEIWIVSFSIFKCVSILCIMFLLHYYTVNLCITIFYVFVSINLKKPGARVLYLGAASGTTVSHVSDIVGPVSSPHGIIVRSFFIFKIFA